MISAREKSFESAVLSNQTLGQKVSAKVYALNEARRVAEAALVGDFEGRYEDMRRDLINTIVEEGVQSIDLKHAAEKMVEEQSLFLHVVMPFDVATSRQYLLEPVRTVADVNPIYIHGSSKVVYPISMQEFCNRIESTMAFESLKLKAKKEELFITLQIMPVLGSQDTQRVIKPTPSEHMAKSSLVITISAELIEEPNRLAQRNIHHRFDGNPVVKPCALAPSFEQIKRQLRKSS